MSLIILIILLLVLIAMAYQDMKYFGISLYLFFILALITIVYSYIFYGRMDIVFFHMAINCLLVLFMTFSVMIFYRAKNHRISFTEKLGLGDVFFWPGFRPSFRP